MIHFKPASLLLSVPKGLAGFLLSCLSDSVHLISCFLVLSIVFCFSVQPLNAQQPEGEPAVEIPAKTHQFDTLREGPPYDHTFILINKGNGPLLINRVKTACRCLTPDWPQAAIQPGDTAKVKVTYFSDNRPGPFFKSIQVYTNIAEAPLKMFYVEGYVRKSDDRDP